MDKEISLTEGNLLKKIILFAIPVMLSGILQLAFNACDLMVVGKFAGDDSLAAVGSTGALISLLVNIFISISTGANVAVARAIGKKDDDKVHNVVHTSILFSIFAGLFLTIIGLLLSKYLLIKMDTNIDILDKAALYLKIIFLGMVFNMLYNFGASIVRATGDTKKPLKYLVIAGIINVILNLFFVIVFNMDVAGVAIATVISHFISSILIIRYLIKIKSSIHLDVKKLRIEKQSLKEILVIGIPAGIQSSLFSISNVFVQKAVNSFKSTAIIAGNAAATNIEGFVFTSMNSLYQANLTFTSQNYGAKKIKNCKKTLLYSLICVTITGLFVGGLTVIFGNPLLNLYANGEDAIRYGMIRVTIIGLTYFLYGISDVIVAGLRGLGCSLVPMIMSIIGICGLRLGWIYTAFEYNHTLKTLYYSYPLSWIITAMMQLVCFLIIYRKRRIENEILNVN